MLTSLFHFADLCDVYAARSGRPFAKLLDEAWPEMAQAWGVISALELADKV